MEKSLTIILAPQKLRFFRKAKDKKQVELAHLIGVERTTYVGYEKRRELEVPRSVADKVAKYLEVELSEIESRHEVKDVPLEATESRDEYIEIHREVWRELKENNKTYKDSLDKLITAVDRTMDNLSKPGNRKN